ncbi:hypothetical protein B0H14DRAFT_3490065 [Mycena olivaceomarginata]|nr:hypothetical protein B0H14DRAFT_3490065 [Mycena olivaceomarginata]
MSEPVQNLRIAYQILERNVIRALRTQRGDTTQLTIQANEALQLLQAAEQHRHAFEISEYATLQQNIAAMVDELEQARHLSSDPPDGAQLIVSHRILCWLVSPLAPSSRIAQIAIPRMNWYNCAPQFCLNFTIMLGTFKISWWNSLILSFSKP